MTRPVVDDEVVFFSEGHPALRFVIPKALR